MIVQQTTTLIFEYPQDYLQEQEWCKTKGDRWVHKSTDTLGAVYENKLSYSIGATADRKTEPDHFTDVGKMADNWRQLRETISELAAWKGGGTQEDVCRYILRYMEILEEET